MSKKTNLELTEEQNNSSKINAIKELIFGENIIEYNHEFEAIKKDILSKKNTLEELIQITKKELIESIDNLNTDLNIRITDLEDNLNERLDNLNEKKVDRRQLGDLLIKLGNKIAE